MRSIAVAAAFGLALAACSKNADTDSAAAVTLYGADGTKTRISQQLPKDLPDYVKIYPGATVTSATDSGGVGTIGLEVSDPPAKILDFYKAQAVAAKLNDIVDSGASGNDDSGRMLILSQRDTKRSLSVAVEPSGDKTQVSLLYGG